MLIYASPSGQQQCAQENSGQLARRTMDIWPIEAAFDAGAKVAPITSLKLQLRWPKNTPKEQERRSAVTLGRSNQT